MSALALLSSLSLSPTSHLWSIQTLIHSQRSAPRMNQRVNTGQGCLVSVTLELSNHRHTAGVTLEQQLGQGMSCDGTGGECSSICTGRGHRAQIWGETGTGGSKEPPPWNYHSTAHPNTSPLLPVSPSPSPSNGTVPAWRGHSLPLGHTGKGQRHLRTGEILV